MKQLPGQKKHARWKMVLAVMFDGTWIQEEYDFTQADLQTAELYLLIL
jgi:hypothetical protein